MKCGVRDGLRATFRPHRIVLAKVKRNRKTAKPDSYDEVNTGARLPSWLN